MLLSWSAGSVLSENVEKVGRRIRELREERGWTQGELALFLGRTQTAVSYWEAGKRAPGLDDLVDLARVFAVPISDLIAQDAARSLPTLLRAVAEEVDSAQLGKDLERFVAKAAAMPSPQILWQINGAGARDTAEALLAAAAVTTAPVPVHALAEGCGVRVLSWDFADVDGLVVQLPEGAVIGVNENQYDRRQRFTVAHELGHHLLSHAESFHVDFGGELSPAATGEHPDYNWRNERAANDFAANLLMPAAVVRTEFTKTADVNELADLFDVSPAAMGFRLTNLRLR
jgi:Zn-dependent peptidase ImmA (M78 family)/transcriptional regulator with XRE-family HTH domain